MIFVIHQRSNFLLKVYQVSYKYANLHYSKILSSLSFIKNNFFSITNIPGELKNFKFTLPPDTEISCFLQCNFSIFVLISTILTDMFTIYLVFDIRLRWQKSCEV